MSLAAISAKLLRRMLQNAERPLVCEVARKALNNNRVGTDVAMIFTR